MSVHFSKRRHYYGEHFCGGGVRGISIFVGGGVLPIFGHFTLVNLRPPPPYFFSNRPRKTLAMLLDVSKITSTGRASPTCTKTLLEQGEPCMSW